MKKLTMIFFVVLFSISLFAQQEPSVKFHLRDGSYKQYKIDDIENIGILKSQSYIVMQIFYQDSLTAYYPTEIIEKIQIDTDSLNQKLLSVYIFTFPKRYLLSEIDSVIFIKDIYQPLTIGSQVWMLKNLDVCTYRNGDTIPQVTDPKQWCNLTTGAWCNYNNSDSLGAIYGKLYNWYAVNDPRSLAPKGWHIPSNDEWTTLRNYLGGVNKAGNKLKEAGAKHWWGSNEGVTNESGFSALPGGERNSYGEFHEIIEYGYWWSITEMGYAWYWILTFSYSDFINELNEKDRGYSVRCIKDK